MNYIRFRFVTLLCILFHSLSSFAYDAEVDGIYYNFSGTTATVTYYSYYYSDIYRGSINIPESVTYNGSIYSVTSIDDRAFFDCSSMTSIMIPSSVTSIGDRAFWGCSGLTSVTIPSSVMSIGNYTFEGCSGLTFVTIEEGVMSIGDWAFSGCSGLTSVTIPSSVMFIITAQQPFNKS